MLLVLYRGTQRNIQHTDEELRISLRAEGCHTALAWDISLLQQKLG